VTPVGTANTLSDAAPVAARAEMPVAQRIVDTPRHARRRGRADSPAILTCVKRGFAGFAFPHGTVNDIVAKGLAERADELGNRPLSGASASQNLPFFDLSLLCPRPAHD